MRVFHVNLVQTGVAMNPRPVRNLREQLLDALLYRLIRRHGELAALAGLPIRSPKRVCERFRVGICDCSHDVQHLTHHVSDRRPDDDVIRANSAE